MEIFDSQSDEGSSDNSQEQEFLATFLQELSDNILALEGQLTELEKNPTDRALVNNIFRTFHNTKGGASMMSFATLKEVTHYSESVVDLVRNDRLTLESSHVDLLFEALGSMREICAHLKEHGKESDERFFHLLAKLVDVSKNANKQASSSAAENKSDDDHKRSESKASDDDLIKVSRSLIDQMMLLVGEFMLLKNKFTWMVAKYKDDQQFVDNCQELEIFSSKMQRNILKLRLSPVQPLFSSMHRVVRSTANEVKKKINLEIIGGETLLDRTILDALPEPLMHMIRNSIDHGVEDPETRRKVNKPEEGLVTLKAQYRSGEIHIDITDDGRGIDVEKIKNKAIEKGFITEDQSRDMQNHEAQNLIFLPGFSAAEKLTAVSGRGVGMDVVRTAIETVGGTIDINTELGVGTSFSLKLPLSLAIIDCLAFKVGKQTYAVPQASVEEAVSMSSSLVNESIKVINDNSRVFVVRDVPIPILKLSSIFRTDDAIAGALILVRHGTTRFALELDQVLGPLSIVTQPLPATFSESAPYSGVTKQGDGSLLFLVDVARLATHIQTQAIVSQKKSTYRTTDGKDKAAGILASSDIRRLQQKIITFKNVQYFCIPVQHAKRIVHIGADEIQEISPGGRSFINLEGLTIPLIWVEELLLKRSRMIAGQHAVLIFQSGNVQYGIPTYEFTGIQRMPENYDRTLVEDGIIGSTVLNDFTHLLLDLHALVEMHTGKKERVEVQSKASENLVALVAEDDSFFASELLAVLRANKVEVILCEDGLEAKKALETPSIQQRINVVITDIEMPNLNGLGLLRWIKSQEHVRDLPCVAYTAVSTEDMRKKVYAAGAIGFISKMSMEPLIHKLNRIKNGDFASDENGSGAVALTESTDNAQRYVTFELCNSWFALPMSVIKEVSPPTPTANIPDAPKWMNRITSFRGNMIPVIDIAKYFEFNDSEVATEQAVIDINGIVFAIMVSRIGEVLTTADLTSGEGLSKVDEKEQRMADYVKSVFKADDRVISAFDPAALATLCTLGQRTKENAKEAA